jgi:hypothetical protein
MAQRGRPPKHQPSADPCFLWARSLDPYVCFIGAFLRQVVADARSDIEQVQRDAEAFLLDSRRLAPWIELTGADIEKMQGALLRAAGLARERRTHITGCSPTHLVSERGDHGIAAGHDFAD